MSKITVSPDIPDVPDAADSCDSFVMYKPFYAEKTEKAWLFFTGMFFLGFASLCTVGIVIVYLWHLVVAERYRWLGAGDLSRIEWLAVTIIVALSMSGATMYFFKKKS